MDVKPSSAESVLSTAQIGRDESDAFTDLLDAVVNSNSFRTAAMIAQQSSGFVLAFVGAPELRPQTPCSRDILNDESITGMFSIWKPDQGSRELAAYFILLNLTATLRPHYCVLDHTGWPLLMAENVICASVPEELDLWIRSSAAAGVDQRRSSATEGAGSRSIAVYITPPSAADDDEPPLPKRARFSELVLGCADRVAESCDALPVSDTCTGNDAGSASDLLQVPQDTTTDRAGSEQTYHARRARAVALFNLLLGIRGAAPVGHLRALLAEDGLPWDRDGKAAFLRWKYPGQDCSAHSVTFDASGGAVHAVATGSHEGTLSSPLSDGPFQVHELKIDRTSLLELATSATGLQQRLRMQRKWDKICAAADRSETGKIKKLMRAIAKIGHQRQLHVQEITLNAMIAMLYEPAELPVMASTEPECLAGLDLMPLCGLALVVDAAANDRIDSLLSDAADSKAFLPICRIDTTAGADRYEGDVEFQEMEEAIALAPLLQPIRLLLDVGIPGEGQPASVQRMARRLRALEKATEEKHDGVLKGLVVESPTSARLLLYVRNVFGAWECWATPPTSSATDFVNSLALAVLRSGRKLVKAFLEIDRKRGGDIAARHALQQQERARLAETYRVPQSVLDAAEEEDRGRKPPVLKVTSWRHARYGILTDDDYVREDA